MNETLDALQRAMRTRDPDEARRLFTEMETAGTLTRADLRAGAGRPLRRGEDAGWLLAVLDGELGGQGDTAGRLLRELREAIVTLDTGRTRTLMTEITAGHVVPADELAACVADAFAEVAAEPCTPRTAPPSADPVPPAMTEAARYADQAERGLEWGAGTRMDTRPVVYALLYIGAAIEAASERQTGDADALAAMLDERLGDLAEAIDPGYVVTPRQFWPWLPQWCRRLAVALAGLRVIRPGALP